MIEAVGSRSLDSFAGLRNFYSASRIKNPAPEEFAAEPRLDDSISFSAAAIRIIEQQDRLQETKPLLND